MASPTVIDKWLHVAQNGYPAVTRYSSRTMAPKAIFIHIQEGNNWGSWQHFHQVKASSTVLIGKNGDIWRLVPEDKAPWTNGDVQKPTTRGAALIAKYGPDPNRYSLTIECEGFSGQDVPAEQMVSIVWQIREWQAAYSLTNDDIYRHADVNSVTRSRCPGDALFADLLKQLGGAPKPKPDTGQKYAQPVFIPGAADADTPVIRLENGSTLIWAPLTVSAVRPTARKQYASSDSSDIGPVIAGGASFAVQRLIINADTSQWWYTPYATRVLVADTKILGAL